MTLSDEERTRAGGSPSYLDACFRQMGFSAYDDDMLEDICRLISMSRLNTLQFDILADGGLGGTFSITSCFERTGTGFAALFQEDGAMGSIFAAYERMGIADGRWRLAEQALFATKRAERTEGGLQRVVTVSIPNRGKAKWIDGAPQPAKIYLLVAATAQ